MRTCTPKCWKIVVLVLLGIAALGWVVMALWNWLMPELFFGVKGVTYIQAMGILLLSKILFGGLRGHCDSHRKWHQQRLENMTPEDREKFKSGLRGWCCKGNKERTDLKE